MHNIQFMFEYEVIMVDPDTGDEIITYIWTTLNNKKELIKENVKSVKLRK